MATCGLVLRAGKLPLPGLSRMCASGPDTACLTIERPRLACWSTCTDLTCAIRPERLFTSSPQLHIPHLHQSPWSTTYILHQCSTMTSSSILMSRSSNCSISPPHSPSSPHQHMVWSNLSAHLLSTHSPWSRHQDHNTHTNNSLRDTSLHSSTTTTAPLDLLILP